ncbi:Transmembrane_domain-containing protein [Hexamita inflata]|uniref:Transmembrane_domain-containing protein n=1 Tax=Hexamita inflata TaxID=28002 RepID=A0ABP1HPM2_9EUKA
MELSPYQRCTQQTNCSDFICSIFTSCYKQSRYNHKTLIYFSIFEALFGIQQIVILVLLATQSKSNKMIKQNYKISIVTLLAHLSRAFWYVFARYYYYANEPVQTQQVLNALSLTFIYLQQSFYVQTWLRLIIILNKMKGEKTIQFCFYFTDSFVIIFSAVIITLRVINGNEKVTETSYYTIFCKFVAGVNLTVGIVYIVAGSYIFVKLRSFYDRCSRSIVSFLIVSITLLFLTSCRFFVLIWKDISGEFMNQNIFGVFGYFLPDIGSTITINCMQIHTYITIKRKNRMEEQEDIIYSDKQHYMYSE